ncbi:hypothetical protein ACFLR1_01605, partial [Bacteroidota bacterium]
ATYKMDSTVVDSNLARVYKQIPPYVEGRMLHMGSSILLYLTQDTLLSGLDSESDVILDSLEMQKLIEEYESFE